MEKYMNTSNNLNVVAKVFHQKGETLQMMEN
jgi:hypothetical protein